MGIYVIVIHHWKGLPLTLMKRYWEHLAISSTFEARRETEHVCVCFECMLPCGVSQHEVILSFPNNIIQLSPMTETGES